MVISQNNNEENSIIGNFRIIDAVGYEYRVNSAARLNSETFDPHFGRFSDDWGSNLADVVGVRVRAENILPDGTFDLTVDRRTFSLNVYDDEETPISCGEVTLGCDEFADVPDTGEFINLGINDVFPNSRGADVLCSGDFNTDGYFELTVTNAAEVSSISAGFVGLNDGNSIGSMVRFKGFPTMPPES